MNRMLRGPLTREGDQEFRLRPAFHTRQELGGLTLLVGEANVKGVVDVRT